MGEVHASAVLENLQLNGFIAGGVAGAAVCGATCVVGKSMLMPVRALEAIGGFAAMRNVLAEDQVIGVRVRKAGYSIRLSHHVIENVNRQRSFRWFLNRHSRWYKIRRQMALPTFLIEPAANLATVGLVWAFSGDSGIAWGGLLLLVGLGMVRDAVQTRRLARVVSQGTASALQPRKRHFDVAPLVRRDHEQTGSVARSSLLGRTDDPAPAGECAASSSTTGMARPQVSRSESAPARPMKPAIVAPLSQILAPSNRSALESRTATSNDKCVRDSTLNVLAETEVA